MAALFQCLSCQSADLLEDPEGHTCSNCQSVFPMKLGVSLFLKQVTDQPSGVEISGPMAESVCRVADIEHTPENVSRLKEIFRHNYHLGSLNLDAENNYYLDRVRAGFDEQVKDEGIRPPIANRVLQTEINRDVRGEFTAHYIPRRLPAGTRVTRNVRFTNTGSSILSSNHPDPVHLSYHWRDKRGNVLEWEGARTQLLIDVLPGQSLTMPMVFDVPRNGRAAFLDLALVQEGKAWFSEFNQLLSVEVVRRGAGAIPQHWKVCPPDPNYDYGADHRQGQAILAAEIERNRRPGMRVLELGGTCNPMAARMGVEIVNVDIDVQTLQIGALRPYPEDRIHWVAADAHDLPFGPASFDAIMMFATLHHFVDPIRVLRQLKPLLKDDGFLAVMCEPVGHNIAPHADEGTLNELRQGINEQAFILPEYDLIFDQAGLEASDLVAHGHSLKAILRPTSRPRRTKLAAPPARNPASLPDRRPGWIEWIRAYMRRAA